MYGLITTSSLIIIFSSSVAERNIIGGDISRGKYEGGREHQGASLKLTNFSHLCNILGAVVRELFVL